MGRFVIGSSLLLLSLIAGHPQSAAAQENCSWCVYCFIYPERLVTTEDEVSNWYVAGPPEMFHCREWEVGYCSELIPCPPEFDSEEEPVEESQLLAAAFSQDERELKDFINAYPGQIEVVLDRELILLRDIQTCNRRIVGVYEVPGLRDAIGHCCPVEPMLWAANE